MPHHHQRRTELPTRTHVRGLLTLSPLLVFFIVYIISSLLAGDFYKMPVTVAFLAASAWAVCVSRPANFMKRIDRFSAGAANRDIMMMIWIFIMAGAFAQAANFIGAVDATVNLTLLLLPPGMVMAGMFLAACLISLSIGTSVGTIVALMPLAVGLAHSGGGDTAIMAGIVIGGAFFGDNLSFISDTTIAATRTQGCRMQAKFSANLRIVLPAAVIVLAGYGIAGQGVGAEISPASIDWLAVLPYLLVLVPAVLGVSVFSALLLGIISTGALHLLRGGSALDWAAAMGQGIGSMGDLIIVTLLAGGMLELIRYNGGLNYAIRMLTTGVHGRRTAELSIALMVSLANCCTANNTVAIVTVGGIAKRIAERYGVSPARSASLLDTFSCLVQGVLPYGAQLLMGASLAGLGTLEIIPKLYYPMVMGALALLYILFSHGNRRTA